MQLFQLLLKYYYGWFTDKVSLLLTCWWSITTVDLLMKYYYGWLTDKVLLQLTHWWSITIADLLIKYYYYCWPADEVLLLLFQLLMKCCCYCLTIKQGSYLAATWSLVSDVRREAPLWIALPHTYKLYSWKIIIKDLWTRFWCYLGTDQGCWSIIILDFQCQYGSLVCTYLEFSYLEVHL